MYYKCLKCNDKWEFCEEDFNEGNYPIICPLCRMPITQMIKEVYKEEGILEVFKRLKIKINI